MIKPASSLCNMRCKYCFYEDVSASRGIAARGIMKDETVDAMLFNIFADLEARDQLTIAFQGGEPTLAGLGFFRRFTDKVARYGERQIQVQYALQTNGLCLDREWCQFLAEHQFLVGLSLDGPAEYHDANRVDASDNGTFRRVMNAKRELERAGVPYNVLMVLTNQAARHPQQIWRFLMSQNIRHIQFIPCLSPLDGSESPCSLNPQRYASFYTAFFDLWFQHYQSGHYISVKLFDDLVHLLAFGQCNACGLLGYCQPQIVVEADGNVYPCDFFALDQFLAGNLTQCSLRGVYESPKMAAFVTRPRETRALCGSCPYRQICNGGCLRMQNEVFYAAADTACGHRMFLEHSIDRLQRLALRARSMTID